MLCGCLDAPELIFILVVQGLWFVLLRTVGK